MWSIVLYVLFLQKLRAADRHELRMVLSWFLPWCWEKNSVHYTRVYLRNMKNLSQLLCNLSVSFVMKNINAFHVEATLQQTGEKEALHRRPGVQDFRWGGRWCWCCWKRLSFKHFSVRATGQIWMGWKGGCNCKIQSSNMGSFSEWYSSLVGTVCQKELAFYLLKNIFIHDFVYKLVIFIWHSSLKLIVST